MVIEQEERYITDQSLPISKPETMFRPSFFLLLFYRFFSQQVSVGGRNKNKIHSDHFPIELKSKETQLCFLRF